MMSVVKFIRDKEVAEEPSKQSPLKPELPKREKSKKSDQSKNDKGTPSHIGFLNGIRIAVVFTLQTIWQIARWAVRSFLVYIWRHPLHATFSGCLLVLLSLVISTGSEIHNRVILGKISEQTVSEIIEASSYTRDFDSLDVKRKGTREFLQVGAPGWMQAEGIKAILFHARTKELSLEHQAVLLAIAEVESGFNSMARASTTTACGLFQFVKRTGESFDLSQADCMNPWLNAEAGVTHYLKNYEKRVASKVADLEGNARLFKLYELSYYLHHDGPNSTSSSDDVRLVIFSGTEFLMKAYSVLQKEAESELHAPTFIERFTGNLWEFLHSTAQFLGLGAASIANAEEINETGKLPQPAAYSRSSRFSISS